MSLLRVAFLEFLICVHVIGAAVLFRRFFPRESPWLGFVIPVMALLMALNFFEHFVALSNLGWLLPLTLGGSVWLIIKPGYSWEGLRLPSILFVATFTFTLGLKCLSPGIPNFTEGAADLTRVLNYSLGGTLPPVDCWMPPYDYGGYYTFQHYGAAIMKRLFFLDLGTAYNLSFALLLALVCLMGAGVAYSISGKKWISVIIIPILLAGSSGSGLFLLILGHPDYALSTALNTAWDDPVRNPFSWICAHDKTHPDLTLVAPTYTIYCSEFHANLGATFLLMASVLVAIEAFKAGRSNWPWVCLFVLPMIILVTSAWYFLISLFFCVGSVATLLVGGKRPESWKWVGIVSIVALILVWPSFYSLSASPLTQTFLWTPSETRTPLWMFLLQWWPIFLPWLLLCFVWHKLNWMSRWMHAGIALFFIWMEFVSFADRGLTVQKMWGALYGIGLITLLPLVFMRKDLFFRSLTAILVAANLYCLGMWLKIVYYDPIDRQSICYLQGDYYMHQEPQRKRLSQVLRSLHGATILPGKSYWAYNEAPLFVTLSENRCYVAYTFQEEECGHGGEINHRSDLNNQFYAGDMASPLAFLENNNITAVLIWPEDRVTDGLLQQFQTQIGSDYFYIDCKMDGVQNAGVFIRQAAFQAPATADSSSNMSLLSTSNH
jgi:hypothetical protein